MTFRGVVVKIDFCETTKKFMPDWLVQWGPFSDSKKGGIPTFKNPNFKILSLNFIIQVCMYLCEKEGEILSWSEGNRQGALGNHVVVMPNM